MTAHLKQVNPLLISQLNWYVKNIGKNTQDILKLLNTHHTIWVKASNAPMTGVQVQIKKSMIEEGWQEGANCYFHSKIMEHSENSPILGCYWCHAYHDSHRRTAHRKYNTRNWYTGYFTRRLLKYSWHLEEWTGYELVFDKNLFSKRRQISKEGFQTKEL